MHLTLVVRRRKQEPMNSRDAYHAWELSNLSAAITKGHKDKANLRTLLICTTSKTTVDAANRYFEEHHHDDDLLTSLVTIALEGEDAGDAPWAAANVLAEFPANMLQKHEAALTELAGQEWIYLHVPGQKAIEKVRSLGKPRME